ncbi:SDR family oxidoreductase [Acidiferrimicrobium sp. IK]|uniref:SDR family NAD(P)-dependent oxidoreductase n=1 Tax=Acidiferrimicrobium sp. IK TaxID=2871700 RepID=UPI0021CB96D3|nr:SDR family NAD(P)-dependent oxidoreductase [Acidiferrimicrobium sp. IK]MCU4184214.1 SDR family oxidoreductase [Acidiferrimicrobium sp. IK]
MTPVAGRFAGQVALVTGAASGIGRAVALRLAAEGASVGCLDIAPAVKETAAEIAASGGSSVAVIADVTDQPSVRGALQEVVDAFDGLDVCCNVAGIGRFCPTEQLALEEWQRVLAVNLTGTFLVAQAALPHLVDRGGVIINTASTSAMQAQPYQAAYCASKGGVLMLTKALALEYLDRRLRVNAIAPGGVDTPVLASFADAPEGVDLSRMTRYMTPLGFAQPEDLASLYAYVASAEAHYMTGAVVTMDGGITV